MFEGLIFPQLHVSRCIFSENKGGGVGGLDKLEMYIIHNIITLEFLL